MNHRELMRCTSAAAQQAAEQRAAWNRIAPKECPMCGAQPRSSCGSDCPLRLADAQQEQADEKWFRRYGRDERIRPTTWSERVGAFVGSGTVLDDYVRLAYFSSRRRDGTISVGWIWLHDVRPEEIA